FEIIGISGDSDGWAASRAALKTQYNQPHAPRPTAVLLSGRRLVGCLCSPCLTAEFAMDHDNPRRIPMALIAVGLPK
ncbi:MAG TPA: hypothetical protein VGU69_13200, partial [Rhizomicrobium sp.]|nr:hypothetical protein [Rhizomicrobium sp.]